MSKITFDRSGVRDLQQEALAVLQAHFDGRGVTVSHTVGKFNPGANAELRFQFAAVNEDGSAESDERRAFKTHAPFQGLKIDDLDRTFVHLGKTFTIAGWRRKATTKPVIYTAECGRNFIFDPLTVRRALAIAIAA